MPMRNTSQTLRRKARPTLTVVELGLKDELRFTLKNGQVRSLRLEYTWARILFSNRKGSWARVAGSPNFEDRVVYGFGCTLTVDGRRHALRRIVGTQESFYEPVAVEGMHLWLDAVDDIFGFLEETH